MKYKTFAVLMIVLLVCSNLVLSQQLSLPGITTLTSSIRDFQVNENAGPIEAYQDNPVIASDSNGNYIVTWADDRNGDDGDIYAQRYSSAGTALGVNFKVNDDVGNEQQHDPAICVTDNGNFVITWTDWRESGPTPVNRDIYIYAQRFSSDGSPLGENFRVNDISDVAGGRNPAIGCDGLGNFVITWNESRSWVSSSDIYAQRFSSDGRRIGGNFIINDDQVDEDQSYPAIAMNKNGHYIITWQDERNTAADNPLDIYAQRFSGSRRLGTNFKVNDDPGNDHQNEPTVDADSSGNFVITWMDRRNGDAADVYAQCYSNTGTAIGANFQVNDDIDNSAHVYQDISYSGDENFIISWTDNREGSWKIYFQRYSNDGTILGSNSSISKANDSDWQFYSSICSSINGNFIVSWMDNRNGDFDNYAQHYSSDGDKLGLEFKVNDDQASSEQKSSVICVDGNGDFVIAWEDCRNEFKTGYGYAADIYAQRFSSNGTVLGNNFKVNEDTGWAKQSDVAIASNSNGDFIITWLDQRDGEYADNIYAQRYSSDDTKIGDNFRVNEFLSDHCESPCIAIDDSGKCVIAWAEYRDSNTDIYAQRFAADGAPIGSNFRINDDDGYRRPFNPQVSTEESGNFIVTWGNSSSANEGIYAQRYLQDGTKLGENIRVSDNEADVASSSLSICNDNTGNFLVSWTDSRNAFDDTDQRDIYAQLFTNDGNLIGTNFEVDEDLGCVEYRGIQATGMDHTGNFVVVWEEKVNRNSNIYAQRYSLDGTKIGQNILVTNITEKQQSVPDVKLWNGLIYTTWTDNRASGTSYDIWANVLDWSNPTPVPVPVEFSLFESHKKGESVFLKWTTKSESNNYGFEIQRSPSKTGEFRKIGFVNGHGTINTPQEYVFEDKNIRQGKCHYRLKQIDLDGSVSYSPIIQVDINSPFRFTLFQNHPNPFNPTTTIKYTLEKPTDVKLTVYNSLGQIVKVLVNKHHRAGEHAIQFDGSNIAGGIYYYSIVTVDFKETKKMLLLQ